MDWIQQPTQLLKKVSSQLSLDNEGRVSYQIGTTFHIERIFGLIKSPKTNIDHEVYQDIFREIIFDLFKNGKLADTKAVLSEFKKAISKTKINQTRYQVVTSIGIENDFIPSSRIINNSKVSFYRTLPKKYQKARKNAITKYDELNLKECDGFLYVVISISSHDERIAFNDAMDTLDLIKGIWELNINKAMNIFSPAPKQKYPTNTSFPVGMLHTVHYSCGKISPRGIWHEQRYQAKKPMRIIGFSSIDPRLGKTLRLLRKSPFKDHIENALQSYSSSRNHDDIELRFLKLWTTLEKILSTDNSKIIIKRISFMYHDNELVREALNSLRNDRNRNVHGYAKPVSFESKCFQLVGILEHMIKYFILNQWRHKSLNEALSFMDSPCSIEGVNAELARLNKVKQLMSIQKRLN
ncbi:hypothetical protein FCL40_17675 [Ferrimonas sediminicola]|uniref:Apea-like HEPN domain-containing protein n=1 Tax=Ferrimonas sediminicola TaxID=2569538 RepID=A0A4U1B7N8_9GAMM|nr:hypothetical protein [Ferrimonas sediminicola]TKB46486.1 hypothetical protein FCL40_17675 [Ferrimonas sediminicola]